VAVGWIKVETCTPGKAEIIRLARLLSMKHDEALGVVIRFWVWADSNTVDGVVDGVAPTDVDAVLSCPGLCRGLETVGWLVIHKDKERITIPKFERHNGESAKKRALNTERQARWRNAHVDADVDGAALPEKRREEKNKKVIAKSVDNSAVVETLPLVKGGEFPVRASLVQELEPLYPAVDIPATLREMKGWLVLNTERRKTRQGIRRFIGNWLQTEQAKHGS
jgi:DNA replication protein DnaT